MPDAVTPTTPQSVRSSAPRPWISPRLAELPKLTQLTLASAIGGGGGTGSGGSTVFGFLLSVGVALGVAGCSADRALQEPRGSLAPASSQLVTCTVRRDAASISCDGPAAAPGPVVTGSQGRIVGLRSSDVSWDNGTDILSATVTVENLSTQPMGTTDGTTLNGGLDVFFVAGPIGPLGEMVGLPNAEGPQTFTSAGQLYFHYDEVLQPGDVSAGQVWEFELNGVSDFTFSVLVYTPVPLTGTFLSWWAEPAVGVVSWEGVATWGTGGVAIFGKYGVGAARDGGSWQQAPDPLMTGLSGGVKHNTVTATGPREIFKVLDDHTTIRYWDGISWRSVNNLPGGPGGDGNQGVMATAPGVLYAAGSEVRKFTVGPVSGGGTWSTLPDATGIGYDCKGMAAVDGRLFCAFENGRVYYTDGTSWTLVGNSGIAGYILFAADTNDLWVFDENQYPRILKHYEGAGVWTTPATPQDFFSYSITSGVALPNGEAYVTAAGSNRYIWRWDGANWTEEFGSAFYAPAYISASDPSAIYAIGTAGVVLKRTAGNWNFESGDFGPAKGNYWHAAYMTPGGEIFLGSSQRTLRHWNGTAWLSHPTPYLTTITELWGTSSSNVYAGGQNQYGLEHWDGSSWTTVDGMSPMYVRGIGGTGPNDVWAVGNTGFGEYNILHFDGGSWAEVTSPDASQTLYAFWAVNSSLAIAVGSSGTIFTWNGTIWAANTSGTSEWLRGTWGSSANDLWAVGENGTIRHWDGISWESGGTSCDGTNTLTAVWGRSSTEIYASSWGGKLCFYDGSSWSEITLPGVGFNQLNAIAGDAFGNRIVVAGEAVYRGSR